MWYLRDSIKAIKGPLKPPLIAVNEPLIVKEHVINHELIINFVI